MQSHDTPDFHSSHVEEAQGRDGMVALLSSLITDFVDSPAEELDRVIMSALQRVGMHCDSQRCYAALFSADRLYIDRVYEWDAENIRPMADYLRGRLLDSIPWLVQQVNKQHSVMINWRSPLPPEASAEQAAYHEGNTTGSALSALILRGETIGFVGLDATLPAGDWCPDGLRLLSSFSQVLMAGLQRKSAVDAFNDARGLIEIQVAERTHTLERRGRVGEALGDILKVLNSKRALPEVLDYIVTQAGKLLEATSTMIRKADLEQDLAITEASYNLPDAFEEIRRTRMYYSASDLILMSRRPVVIPDLQSTYAPVLNMPETMDDVQSIYLSALLRYYRSMMSVPLFIKEEIYGSLTFYFNEPREFSEEDIQLAMALGDQAALAIENTRLYREEQLRREEAERRRQVAESLRDVISVLNSPQALNDILQMIVNEASNLLNTDAAAIYMLWRDEDVLTIRASRGLSEDVAAQVRIPIGKGLAGHAVMSLRPVVVSDAAAAWGLVDEASLLREEQDVLERLVDRYRAFLSVPLAGKDEVYGAVTLYFHDARRFSQDEIELSMAFADQAALAIENAQLRSSSEQAAVATERTRLARDLHDSVTQTLFSAAVISEVLPRVWERDPEEGRRRLDELRQLSRAALAEMRTLLLELRPAALVETPLDELLQQLTEAVNGSGRLRVELKQANEILIDQESKVTLYRIAQEALNNAVKHSAARTVLIQLESNSTPQTAAHRVRLVVQDDGVGFDPARIPPNHLGVSIMRERAQAIGADFEIESSPGQGTRVTLILPAGTAA